MTKEEMMRIVKALQTYYPHCNMLPNADAIRLWYEELKDLAYEQVVTAIRKHVNTSDRVITIHNIRQNCSEQANGNRNWTDGWDLVVRAVKRFGHYREEEALGFIKEHDEDAYRVAKSMDFKHICLSAEPDVVRGQFRMAYEQKSATSKEQAMLPSGLKTKLSNMIEHKVIKEIE